MNKGIHRVTADSKRGRQIAADTRCIEQGPGPTAEQQEHNARIEAARLQKIERRKARREPK